MRRAVLIWGLIAAPIVAALIVAAFSPLLTWRQPIYIASSFLGIAALGAALLQPLLAKGRLPGVSVIQRKRLHLWIGPSLVVLVLGHVTTLWITSPPDVVDALLLASPTPFSIWGVLAMWILFAQLASLALRRRLRPRLWRTLHTGLALAMISATSVHVALIDGTLNLFAKTGLCGAALAAVSWAIWTRLRR